MANHLRTQCRDAAKTLVTGLTTTGSNAFAGRAETRPLQGTELPGLLLYTTETEVDEDGESGAIGTRRVADVCELLIEGYAKGTGDVDAQLDTMEKEVRAALGGSPTLSGKAKDLKFIGSTKEDATVAEKPTWLIRMRFRLEYHTRETAPDTALA